MIRNILHSKEFIKIWKQILIKLYGYDEYMDFLVVPSISNKKTLSYLPLLNYTDVSSNHVQNLLELSKENRYLIRSLNSSYSDFREGDAVTMRLDLTSNSYDYIFKELFLSKCRNQIRKALKSDLVMKIGGNELLVDFYQLFSETMYKYGTPVFSCNLFELIIAELDSKILVVYKDAKPIACLLLMVDKELSIIPWSAFNVKYSKLCPNHLLYSEAIKYSLTRGCKLFDFGRSQYGSGNTYKFKKQWGALPVKIDMLREDKVDIYTKYKLAATIWKYLPKFVVNALGPRLCKYLVDL